MRHRQTKGAATVRSGLRLRDTCSLLYDMQDYRLTPQELGELRAAHRRMRDAREAYRINAVILLGTGWRVRDIAEALLIDPDTVRSHFQRFREGGITALLHMNYVGSEAWLDAQQLQELDQHLLSTLYLTAAEIAGYVQERWRVCYTLSGMTALLPGGGSPGR